MSSAAKYFVIPIGLLAGIIVVGHGAQVIAQRPLSGSSSPYFPFRSPARAKPVANTKTTTAFPGRAFRRDSHLIEISPIRTLMRKARTPFLTQFGDGTLLLTSGAGGGESQTIYSFNFGATWRHYDVKVSELNTVELDNGRLLMLDWKAQPLSGGHGWYQVKRTEFLNRGTRLAGPYLSKLYLPPNRFDPALPQWFHGNIIRTHNNELVAVMQGKETWGRDSRPWRSYVVHSRDRGQTWHYLSTIADWSDIGRLEKLLTRDGLAILGAAEPCIIELERNHLVAVMRTVDDETNVTPRQFAGPQDEFADLNQSIRGDGVHPGVARLAKNKYYQPGPPSTPLLISHSFNGGVTWTAPQVMRQARGCFPRLAHRDGVLALTYGGLSALRWGNCVTFSFDGGKTWTDEINFAPFFTSGYTNIAALGRNRFIAFFDSSAPQPWTNREAHWIGAVDISLRLANRQ